MSIEARYQNSRIAKILPEPGELVTRDPNTLPGFLYELADAYPEVGLKNLQPGMYVYGVVSEVIMEATNNSAFEYNPKMQQNMMTFADQHTQAVHNLIHGKRDELNEWEEILLDERLRDEPGVLASRRFYVNHTGPDLFRTQVLTGTDPALHEKDYYLVDDYLRQAGRIALKDVMVMSRPFEKLKIPEFGLSTTMNMIIKRRKRVMHGYKLAYYADDEQRPIIQALVEEELRRGTIQDNKTFDNIWVSGALRRATRPSANIGTRLRSKLVIPEDGIIPIDLNFPVAPIEPIANPPLEA